MLGVIGMYVRSMVNVENVLIKIFHHFGVVEFLVRGCSVSCLEK